MFVFERISSLSTNTKVTPGKILSSQQQTALGLVARIHGKRDVVLAIDLTDSVGINDEGRIRLQQIIEDSLKLGDSVYIVPFAVEVVPLQSSYDLYPLGIPIEFSSHKENFDKVIQKIPLAADLQLQNTDIQQAELTIYQGLAQLNQNRLQQNHPIKAQSVVWMTDAPLLAKSGNDWIETPANSPFRVADSSQSKERQAWLNILPLNKRELTIENSASQRYKLAVVDIEPTVQEFCTIAPNNKEFCKVNSYLIGQLWLPLALTILGLFSTSLLREYLLKLRCKCQISVSVDLDKYEKECRPLLPVKALAIGQTDSNCIDEIDYPGSKESIVLFVSV
ncbi:hypothetical protein Glo7428_1657 [Gloeocapsa sp. PCC 7428]|uniref:hypothetical protein n=1 Tax=Gloeocapsa sp. PCC 7428 TaxID=1173026 RepID=UPI0002A5D620|nr:hypothetical protein [Gloeocapsa sp. PCC 7428]AFZ30214.1 hypothetical protein Glo7428_1657 [Gloeocapsa sp. PCC 7428]